jgi:tRNA threonylcarbamoyladenosine biosynthesis protein TsaB
MRVLALDTTTRAGSVALLEDERVIDEREGDSSRTHAERLPGDLIVLLAAHGQTLADVELFAVASGPGSFTGLRVGIATVQGAAFVHQRPVVGVSALEALAHAGALKALRGDLVGAWMDAHRDDVFSALYRVDGDAAFAVDRLAGIDAPQVGRPAATLARWRAQCGRTPIAFVGDGAVRYAEVIASDGAEPAAHVVRPTPLLAGAIGRIALARVRAGAPADPAGVQPLYVRRPDAEIARESAPPQRTRGTQR